MEVSEGQVTLSVPEQPDEGAGDAVFYNDEQELNRDLTVAVLRAYRDGAAGGGDAGSAEGDGRDPGAKTYLDATAATGVRGVRAAADGWDVTLCDVDPDAVERCERNLERNGLDGRVVRRDANALMHEEGFDVVDLDPFGTPIPFADAAFNSARGLVCVTATDTAPLCGAHFESGVRSYSAVPRNTEYHAEMGLRILLGALARTAARYDVGVTPILSHATRHYVRTYLDCSRRATDADAAVERLGHLHHCQDCLHRTAEAGLIPHPPDACPACDGERVVTAGPLWLAPVRDREFVAAVRERVGDDMGTAGRARGLCDRLRAELDTPTHYDQHRLCKEWGRPASAMDEFVDALRAAGHDASRAHYGGTAFKTDAAVDEIRAATADLH